MPPHIGLRYVDVLYALIEDRREDARRTIQRHLSADLALVNLGIVTVGAPDLIERPAHGGSETRSGIAPGGGWL
jgi:hypothetical protein